MQQIVAYIKQYSAKYPVASLKAQLLKQGVPAATIDQAIAMATGTSPGGAPAGGQARPAVQPARPAAQPGQPAARPPQPGQPVARPAQPGQPAVRPGQPQPQVPQARPAARPGQPVRQPNQSAPPGGTTQGSPVQAAPKGGVFKPPPGRSFILVVDDDPLIRDMLVAKLEGAGYRVTCAEDAAQSVIQAEGMNLSLIISDIEMPGFGTGVDALKKLRASNYIPRNLPVIFVTGMPPSEAQKIVPKSDPYIRLMHKPVDWRLLAKYMLDLSGLDKPLD
ncbi:MAG: hypothetical protein AUJ52_15765 [Elusimicrobia bacterium CG1_02_63_36]|nr:MAG: hypothetical protein AUJ52_15765 [Elusimicrobia bacterium CG1_02_63_36]PIP81469.1 MAG: hypothetical protein COR54_20235 [Elusimicrobia bacterium CG22_combo_CG10-13_8_21_14_all_63_91]PJA17032.1 MAG: hypothetical protein COX66_05880 [Elusimicrobia bacterium CG_4_10_14_0_2_um_filter_63_34]PJB25756.1 MAG: hypothetical protein CO113_07135 [Elusimicrobia bacterium CG_4_9_14_3_um_filter_62_55]